ncbi:PAS domain S-box protein [candidate division KSB1 bacterium]|nr:PAS domain S-box protein [candidate division KSB1 bacterium]
MKSGVRAKVRLLDQSRNKRQRNQKLEKGTLRLKLAEKKRCACERHLRSVLNSIDDAVIIVDVCGNISLMNPAAEELTGWKMSAAEGKHISDVHRLQQPQPTGQDTDPLIRMIEKANLAGFQSDNLCILKDGRKYPISISAEPVTDVDGHTNNILLIFKNQTKAFRSNQSSAASEAGIWYWNIKTGKLAFDELLGYRHNELPATIQEWEQFYHPEEINTINQKRQQLLRGEIPTTEGEYRLRSKSGEWRRIYTKGKVVEWGTNREPEIFIGTAMDITDRKWSDALAGDREGKNKVLMNASPYIALLTTPAGKILYANDGAQQAFGRTSGQFTGVTVSELYAPRIAAKMLARMQSVVQTGKSIRLIDEENDNWIEESVSPIFDDHGEVKQLAIFARDITERKAASEEIRIRNQIAHIFLTAPDEDMYTGVLDIVLDAMKSKFGVFGYLDEKGDLRVPTMTRTIMTKCEVEAKDIVFPRATWGNSSWPRAIREKKPNYSNQSSKLVPKGHIPIERYMSMPIVHREEVIGLFQVANKETEYNETDLQTLQNIADYVAPVLDARLQRDRNEKARMQAEAALHLSEKRYRTLIKVTGQLAWVTNAVGEVVEDIPSWREFTGQEFDEIKGWGWIKAIHPDDTKKNSQKWSAAIKIKSNYETEFRVRAKNGQYRWFLSRAVPMLDAEGSIQQWIGMCIDIHDQKQAQMKLQESEARFRGMFESRMIGILFWNVEGDITDANNTFLEMVGYAREDLLSGKLRWSDLTPPQYKKLDEKMLAEIISTGVGTPIEKEYMRKDRSRIPILLGAASLPGSAVNGVAFVLDITRRRRIEKERERLNNELTMKNKELEQVLYATSHDLRSPLVNIQGFNKELEASLKELNSLLRNEDVPDILKQKCTPIIDVEIPESLHYILSSTSKMDALLSGLLTLSRLGRQKLTIRKLDMNNIMQDIISTLEYEIKEKKVKFLISELHACQGDELQINRVFSNLIENALKNLDPSRPGVITIFSKKEAKLIYYYVQDNGIGIPLEHQNKIFDLFHKLDPKKPGIGLGLHIVKQILGKHRGHIEVQSEPGEGTRFIVVLPGSK